MAETRARGDEPITASTAILLCIRNEPPERMIRNLEPMLAGLDAAGCGERFHLYVLSDTSDAGHRGERRGALRRACRALARPHRRSPTAAATVNTGLQGRQHPRLLRALGRRSTNSP